MRSSELPLIRTRTRSGSTCVDQRILLVPVVCLSYGGDLLSGLPGYAELRTACEESGVELLAAPMSITGMVNVGEGAVVLGFAAAEHTVDF